MNKQKKPLYFYYLLILIVIVAGNMLFSAMEQNRIKDVSYNTFIQQTEQKKIDSCPAVYAANQLSSIQAESSEFI